MSIFISKSEKQTFDYAKQLAEKLALPVHVLLYGELGAGKTTFTKGLAAGLGVSDITDVSSPTFTISNQYIGRVPIYHVDLYRIERGEVTELGLDDIFDEAHAAVVVEWADKFDNFDPGIATHIHLTYVDASTRRIEIRFEGETQ